MTDNIYFEPHFHELELVAGNATLTWNQTESTYDIYAIWRDPATGKFYSGRSNKRYPFDKTTRDDLREHFDAKSVEREILEQTLHGDLIAKVMSY